VIDIVANLSPSKSAAIKYAQQGFIEEDKQ
jgi:hypothetical protein